MLDLEKIEDGTEKADDIITNLKNILKKHWGFLLLCVVIYCVYVFMGMVGEEMKKPNIDNREPVTAEPSAPTVREHEKDNSEYAVTKATFFIDDFGYRKGDTVYVDYYSDGVVEEYYTDFEIYKKQ